MTNVNAPAGLEAYTYDGVGNRLTSSAASSIWQYNKNNELINQDGTEYTCDATGNIITRTGSQPLTFLYDEAGRLTEVQDETSAA